MHKRTSGVLARMNWLLPVAAVSMALLGCPGQELAPLSPCTVSAVTERVDQAGVSDVDLLFTIDNSGSMASKQAKLAKQLPRLIDVLTSGDRCAGLADADCMYTDNGTPKRHFTAVKSLHLGVVTSNAGGIDNPPMNQVAILSCKGEGDDGKLQNSTDIAVNGVIANKNEFQGKNMGDVVIPADPSCDLGSVPRYQEYTSTDKSTLATTKTNFGCVAHVGVRGCPFEQHLESAWKALAPSSGKGNLYKFINQSTGQGDDYNKGFLREDAILAIVIVADEDDCGITDAGKVMFITGGTAGQEADLEYHALNLRCGFNADRTDLIWPTERYITGLQSLKPDNPDRIIFAAITGVPQEAIKKKLSYDDILALPEMQFSENPANLGFPNITCSNKDNTEVAYPGIRHTEVVKGFGEQGILYSICEDDYAPALDLLIEKIANKLKGNCLPRRLNPDSNGRVNCEVFELLPNGVETCDPDYGLFGKVVKRTIRENGKTSTRNACQMTQVPIANGMTPAKDVNGWYYDYFSESLKMDCSPGEQQRITFKFADGTSDLPSGSGATFECFQPVARIDKNAKGLDAVNISCKADPQACDAHSDKMPGGYSLICLDATLSCQISCASNPQCPPGWVCAPQQSDGADKSIKFCQQPTCPQDNTAPSTDEMTMP